MSKERFKRKLMELLLSSSDEEPSKSKRRKNCIISDSDSDNENVPPAQEENKAIPPEFLEKIGHVTEKDRSFELNADIAKIWNNTLKNGLMSETKKKLMEDIEKIRGISTTAPLLNCEIKASLTQHSITRDNHLCEKQNQIGSAICGLSKLLNKLLENNDTESAEKLSNCIRLLCDVHYLESKTRRSVILPGLNKNLKDALEKTEISESLFGKNVSELIKENKSIEKSTKELRPSQPLNNWGPSANKRQGGQSNHKNKRPQRLDGTSTAKSAPPKRQQQQRQYLRSLTRDKQKPQNPTRNYRRHPY